MDRSRTDFFHAETGASVTEMTHSAAAARPAVHRPLTVVIAAHNEAAVIGRCLTSILRDAADGEIGVLVASNGSTDGTAEVARSVGASLGHQVEAIEIATASKIAALRAAELVLAARPAADRVYVDADIIVDTAAIRLLSAALAVDTPRLALVAADVDTAGCSLLARTYFRTWAVLARNRDQGSGSGVLAINPAGAGRIASWPDVLSDDEWVVRQFAPAERVVVDASARSFAARTTLALLRRRARVVNGLRQLDLLSPHAPGAGGAAVRANQLGAARKKGEISRVEQLTYVAVTVAARLLAGYRRHTGNGLTWSTDTSTRGAPPARDGSGAVADG
jgi:hypothetical protein